MDNFINEYMFISTFQSKKWQKSDRVAEKRLFGIFEL